MLRTRWFVAGSLILALGACKKEEGGDKPADKPGDQPTPAVKPADPPKPVEAKDGPPTEPIKQGSNTDDLALLPRDSLIVLGINIAQLQTSSLWKDYIAEKVITDDVKHTLDELKSKCSLDAMQMVKSASIAVGCANGAKDGVIVVHGLDKTKTLACADKIKGDVASKVEVTRDGDVAILKAKTGGALAFSFVNDDTAIAVFGGKATVAGVKQVAAGTDGLKGSGRFVSMYNKLETTQSGWMMINGRFKGFEAMGKMGLKPKAVFGSIDVTNGVAMELRVRLDSADQATQWAITMKQQLGAMGGMLKLDKLDVTHDADDLKVAVAVTPTNLPNVTKQLKAIAKMSADANANAGGGGMCAP